MISFDTNDARANDSLVELLSGIWIRLAPYLIGVILDFQFLIQI
jgi:hypothetical protein